MAPYPGLLQHLNIPTQAWQDISMDFTKALAKSEAKNTITVIVERLTKSSHFIPLIYSFTTSSIMELFFNNVVETHGLPRSLFQTGIKIFISILGNGFFNTMGTKLNLSTSYHPRPTGKLKELTNALKDIWFVWLTVSQRIRQNSYH